MILAINHVELLSLLEEATEGQKYNPWREKHLEERAVGLDFDDVFSLWQWLDAATPTVEWILPEGVEWKKEARPWTDLEWWDLCYAEEICIYTDGSASSSGCAASAVFFILTQGQWFFGGYLCHVLQGEPCAHRAELHGLIAGLHWLNETLRRISYFQQSMPKITFAFDATSAGYKAFGEWGGSRFQGIVANIRAIIYFVEARFGVDLNYEHVLGHRGHPGNEAADTIAYNWTAFSNSRSSVWVDFLEVNTPWEIQWLWTIWKREWKDLWKEGRLLLPQAPKTFPTNQVWGSYYPSKPKRSRRRAFQTVPIRYYGMYNCLCQCSLPSPIYHWGQGEWCSRQSETRGFAKGFLCSEGPHCWTSGNKDEKRMSS